MKGASAAGRTRGRARSRNARPWLFRLILVLLPWVLLGGIEGTLRLAGVGRPPSFFVPHQLGFKTLLQINPEIGRRFFPPSLGGGIPVPSFQILPEQKPAGTKRIFCLGESTTAGFPFPVTGGFPAILQTILTERDPSVAWEVTNCGLTGISASTIASLIDEMLSAHPDLLVVYMGHNEFYGAGGVGSRGYGAGGLVGSLRKLRIVRLMEEMKARAMPPKQIGTLMERMVARSNIPPESGIRRRAFRNFERQLDTILDAAAAAKVDVILCEVVSNERDLYPFGSEAKGAPDLAALGIADWKDGRPGAEQARAALPILEREATRDSLHAGLRYLRGSARFAAGADGAARDLTSARNLDAVPFRAPDPINEVIRAEATRRRLPLVETERIFRAAAPGGIPGEESFVEHLHPTFMGNARIASAVADRLLGRAVAPVSEGDAGRWLASSGVSRLDLALGDARIAQLFRRWPYTREGKEAAPLPYRARSIRLEGSELLAAGGDSAGAAYLRGRDPEEEQIVKSILGKRTDLLKAHAGLARDRAARGDFAGAAREYVAATRLFPVDAGLWTELAEARLRLGDREGAVRAAQTALVWNPTAARAQDLLRRASG